MMGLFHPLKEAGIFLSIIIYIIKGEGFNKTTEK